jgi:hypothetical protein
MSKSPHRRRRVRHSIDLNDSSGPMILASVRPATPLFHRTLRRSVQDSHTYQAIVPMSMGRVHLLPSHQAELKGMLNMLSASIRIRRGSQHALPDSPYYGPAHGRRRLIAKSPFPMRSELKNASPPDTPTRRTPTPAGKLFKLPRGVVEEYEGDYLNGLSHGEGKALYSNGDTYQGQWFEGKKQGQGTQFYNYFASVYQGEWKNDEKHGFGVMKMGNGDEIQGQWENGTVSGDKVTILYANSCQYVGGVVRGVKSGKGVMKYVEGAEYCGEWKEDLRDGLGWVSYKESWFFEGFFKSDATDGPGVLCFRGSEQGDRKVLRFSASRAFHPVLPFLQQLQSFPAFLKRVHYTNDFFLFSLASGAFQGGKLNG